jgi:signal transduction histidine kinase
MYRENGFSVDYLGENEIPSIGGNETFYFNELTSDQDKFEYYNQILNIQDSNFLYYVKNINTGAEYYSPLLESEQYDSPYVSGFTKNFSISEDTYNLSNNISDFITNISKCDAYLALNTTSTIYNTNVTKWGLINSSTLEWMSKSVKTKLNPTQSDDENSDTYIEKEGNDEYIIYTAVIHSFPYSNDDFHQAFQSFQAMHDNYKTAILYLPIVFILFLIFLIIGVQLAGYSRKQEGIALIVYDKLNTEMTSIILLGSFLILLNMFFELINTQFKNDDDYFYRLLGLYIGIYPIFMYNFFSLVRHIKTDTLRTNLLSYRLYQHCKRNIQQFFTYRSVTFRATGIVVILYLVALFITLFFRTVEFPVFGIFLLSLAFFIVGKYFVMACASISHLINEAKKISDGDLNHKINEADLIPNMRVLAHYINNISLGLSTAVDEKLKSERFKTELITNVSHDIKTPLTSIINYVDLLKKEKLDNEIANQYIGILDSKSQRLKTLIEDLVEASKASSGAITLHMQKINFVELIKQTIGEFEDRLNERNLEVLLTMYEEPLYIYADGRSTFRILENIFSNVYKYALAGTRVYVDIMNTQDQAIVSIKNISASKLNISADELMERFVRGDLARSTEGSGLGLSIAQSLATLQEATFNIQLDGDLFKAVVIFPRIQVI